MLTLEESRKRDSEVANSLACLCLAIVGGMFGVFFAIIIGLENIAGVFGAIGFFVTIIIYKVHKQSLLKVFGGIAGLHQ